MLGISQQLQEKWAPVLDHGDLPRIEDNYKKAVTSILLENQERISREERQILSEATITTGSNSATGAGVGIAGFSSDAAVAGPVAGFDPVLISMIRRSMPNLVAYDLAGVQPMSGPTGLIFAMRAKYDDQNGAETFYNEVKTGQSGAAGTDPAANIGITGDNPAVLNDVFGDNEATRQARYGADVAMGTDVAEGLDSDGATPDFREMGFGIEKVSVTAKSRALKASYSIELAQDLRAIHGLDAESELANILSAEILAEINREIVRTIYKSAKRGAEIETANQGIFDMDVDSNGRWSVEKFKGLLFQIERDANKIAQETRRGKGNMIMCSADVASALAMAGVLDYTPALEGNNRLQVADTGNTFAGVLNGRFRVYVDPYATVTRGGTGSQSGNNYYVVGYKGTSPYDAGMFYCPYVPLQMVRSVGAEDFQPRIGFKTRYGMVLNPFAKGATDVTSNADPLAAGNVGSNVYYRRVSVKNLM